MKRAAAYIRVSTEGQTDKFGIPAQREMIERYCEEHDLVIAKWFEEQISGAEDERPIFYSMLYDESDIYDAVIVAKSDRVARDINIYYYYKMELRKRNKELISVSEDFGAYGDFGKILEAFIVSVAEIERTNIAKRTSAGRKQKANKGGYAGGRPPYGYKVENHNLVINEEEAEIVRTIITARHRGYQYSEILDILANSGFRNRKGHTPQPSFLQVILRNEPIYYGYYRYGKDGQWIKGQQEPIMTDGKLDKKKLTK